MEKTGGSILEILPSTNKNKIWKRCLTKIKLGLTDLVGDQTRYEFYAHKNFDQNSQSLQTPNIPYRKTLILNHQLSSSLSILDILTVFSYFIRGNFVTAGQTSLNQETFYSSDINRKT